jgi:hypothetical protein
MARFRHALATALALLALPLGVALASGHTGRISDAAAQRSNRTAVAAIEAWRSVHGSYARATVAGLSALRPSLHGVPGLALTRVSAAGYRITTHATTGRSFRATRHPSTGRLFFACTPAGRGACRAGGTWAGRH